MRGDDYCKYLQFSSTIFVLVLFVGFTIRYSFLRIPFIPLRQGILIAISSHPSWNTSLHNVHAEPDKLTNSIGCLGQNDGLMAVASVSLKGA
jgi:hypothetical protein